mgnify:FL=1
MSKLTDEINKIGFGEETSIKVDTKELAQTIVNMWNNKIDNETEKKFEKRLEKEKDDNTKN